MGRVRVQCRNPLLGRGQRLCASQGDVGAKGPAEEWQGEGGGQFGHTVDLIASQDFITLLRIACVGHQVVSGNQAHRDRLALNDVGGNLSEVYVSRAMMAVLGAMGHYALYFPR